MYDWTKTFGGKGNEGGESVTTDASGNSYLTGYFTNSMDIDPGAGTDTRTSAGSKDLFLSKYDSSGNYQWTRTRGGTGSDTAVAVTTDASNNI